jgi:hypothetical protein
MATIQDRPDQSEAQARGGLALFARQRRPIAYGLLTLGVLLVVLAGWLIKSFGWEYSVAGFAVSVLAILLFGAGMVLLWRPEMEEDPEKARLMVLSAAGFSGILITLVGLVLAWQWWDEYLGWLQGEPGQRAWRAWVSLGTIFGGLAIMFAGLQVARTEVRANPVMRRLLYGYNSVLTALLLLAILAVVNVLVYVKFSTPFDFTASSMYTLSSRSQSILSGLDKPTYVYVILPESDLIRDEMRTLLSNCRAVNDKLRVEYVSPDEIQRVRQLQQAYAFSARSGVLVVAGDEKQAQHQFIPRQDLFSVDNTGSRDARDIKFKGEDALMTALNSLEEGQTKPVVYFTQGHGELNLSDTNETEIDEGAGTLKARLEKRGYDIKPLTFAPANPKVPDDAAIVVIARPTQPFTPPMLQALRSYMNPTGDKKKKGKLFILFDVVPSGETTMAQTGLESFVKEFNVEVGNERILTLSPITQTPAQVVVVANPDLSRANNPLGPVFRNRVLLLYEVRPVRPQTAAATPPGGSTYNAEPLLYAAASQQIWLERDLRTDAVRLANDVAKETDEKVLDKKLSKEDIPVAVIVTEPSTSNDPHAFMRPPAEKSTPRLAVFGDASVACNMFTSERRSSVAYEIVANTLDWLRERPQSIGVEPKTRNFFVLEPTTNRTRMILLPAALMLLAIAGLGAGVWLVRRR